MKMKIAIQKTKNGFDSRWIDFCIKNGINYKIVDAYSNNIVQDLADCDVFMWHHHHASIKDVKFAKQLLFSLEQAGMKVFPNFNTNWHFDDKLGQKYLLEAIHAPLVPTYAFYTRSSAIAWINSTTFPKVFKLRGGAGSYNVKLVRDKSAALRLVKRAFGKGFSQYSKWENLKERWYHYKKGHNSLLYVLKGIGRLFYEPPFARFVGHEKGYIYFQDFIENNDHDIRVIVIGDKAFAITRLVREHDFRASGSGNILYDHNLIDIRCISIAFDVALKLKSQCTAFDFVFDKNSQPLIVEISYGFAADAYDQCEGYWDRNLNWIEGHFNPYAWMIQNIMLE